jgi:SIR2-like protein
MLSKSKSMARHQLMVFLGSGVSFDSGLPSVAKLTDDVLCGSWHGHTDSNFYPGETYSVGRPKKYTDRIQNFLRLLHTRAENYFRTRRGTATYEDLFFLSRQLEDELRGNTYNPGLEDFVSGLRQASSKICVPLSPIETSYDLAQLANDACDYIECVVWHNLRTVGAPKGLDALPVLCQCDSLHQVTICTLNHDLLIETVLDTNRIAYADGFGEADGDIRWFDPASYDRKSIRVRLYKLHGSIDWWRMERPSPTATVFSYGIVRKDASPTNCKDKDGNRMREVEPHPRFLTGSYNKISDYRYGVFGELHLRFFRALREHRLIVMSGYGWNDRGINGWLVEWLSSSKENRIVLLHREPEKRIRDESMSSMWHRFDDLVADGQLILIRKWFSGVDLPELLEAIRR